MTTFIKTIIAYMAVLLSFFIAGNPENIVATVNGTITTETQVISVTVKNETGKIVNHSSVYITRLEQKINDEWVTVGTIDEIPDDLIVFYPTLEYNTKVNIYSFGIESLSAGEYRFVLTYNVKMPENTKATSYGYFSVVVV